MKPLFHLSFSLGLLLAGSSSLFAQNEPAPPIKTEEKKAIAVSSMAPEELEGFSDYSPALQSIVRKALELTRMNLGYAFGSSDPKSGGMDCSGSVYYVLQACDVKDVPRQSDEICRWVLRYSTLFRTESAVKFTDATFSALRPGDLVFWSGTYAPTTPRELPISHVMIYLGKRVKDHQPVLFGASDGRTYEGQRRNGVSIFDFSIPSVGSKSAIYGYGRIPEVKVLADEPEETQKKTASKPAKPKKKSSQRD
jgi:hypothetical protein